MVVYPAAGDGCESATGAARREEGESGGRG